MGNRQTQKGVVQNGDTWCRVSASDASESVVLAVYVYSIHRVCPFYSAMPTSLKVLLEKPVKVHLFLMKWMRSAQHDADFIIKACQHNVSAICQCCVSLIGPDLRQLYWEAPSVTLYPGHRGTHLGSMNPTPRTALSGADWSTEVSQDNLQEDLNAVQKLITDHTPLLLSNPIPANMSPVRKPNSLLTFDTWSSM